MDSLKDPARLMYMLSVSGDHTAGVALTPSTLLWCVFDMTVYVCGLCM